MPKSIRSPANKLSKEKSHCCSIRFLQKHSLVNPLNLESDQYLISPYNNTAELLIKTVRIKEMITNLRSFDC